MKWVYDDGGRSQYFKAEKVGDCVTRSIAIATGKDYKEVYDAINRLAKAERTGKRKKGKSSARDGVYTSTAKKYIEQELGWVWVPKMKIGSGCTCHVREDELPSGNLILSLSKHYTAVKDGVIHDTYDCSREGTRCVYGYWRAPKPSELPYDSENFKEDILRLLDELEYGYIDQSEFGRVCTIYAKRRRDNIRKGVDVWNK